MVFTLIQRMADNRRTLINYINCIRQSQNNFFKNSKIQNTSGLTGKSVAEAILESEGLYRSGKLNMYEEIFRSLIRFQGFSTFRRGVCKLIL
jgi:hypothetical protein